MTERASHIDEAFATTGVTPNRARSRRNGIGWKPQSFPIGFNGPTDHNQAAAVIAALVLWPIPALMIGRTGLTLAGQPIFVWLSIAIGFALAYDQADEYHAWNLARTENDQTQHLYIRWAIPTKETPKVGYVGRAIVWSSGRLNTGYHRNHRHAAKYPHHRIFRTCRTRKQAERIEERRIGYYGWRWHSRNRQHLTDATTPLRLRRKPWLAAWFVAYTLEPVIRPTTRPRRIKT